MHYLKEQNFLNKKIYISNPSRKSYKKARWKKQHNRTMNRMVKNGWYKTSFILS